MTEGPPAPALRERLRTFTTARVALGRVGSAVPTTAMLDFQLAHARARDAVHNGLPPGALGATIAGHRVIEVHSQAVDRATYLMRPDLGRSLLPGDADRLRQERAQLAIVIADGLSATAVLAHARQLAQAIVERAAGWSVGPIIVAHQARVALGDQIGEALGADMVVMLIGERPGLSAADSLSAYLTWAPRRGRLDSERNCVSNIRPPHGWAIDAAALEIMRTANRARAQGCSGVAMQGNEALPAPD
ncbi:MAG TPA: ethanolamine ammonia-lyase subunit EutC [Novosphingobium sp.]|nr:ethanolamine ammonia-lyase subunit EutC [Novosphingobium sp.]